MEKINIVNMKIISRSALFNKRMNEWTVCMLNKLKKNMHKLNTNWIDTRKIFLCLKKNISNLLIRKNTVHFS